MALSGREMELWCSPRHSPKNPSEQGRKCTAPGLKVLWVYYWLYMYDFHIFDSLSPYLIVFFSVGFFPIHKRQLVLDKKLWRRGRVLASRSFAENQAMRSLWHENGTVAGWFLQDLLPEKMTSLWAIFLVILGERVSFGAFVFGS